MFIAKVRKTIVVAALCSSGALIAACGSSERGSSEDDKAAGRANIDAMSREHSNGTTERGAGPGSAPRKAVISENMPYAEVNDELVYGYFVAPADMFEPLPAVIMIHEWWGLNDNVQATADRLAAEGYIVLAVDLFGGKNAANPAEARQLLLSVVEDPESANANIRGAYDFVSATAGAPTVGSLGWGFGGAWSLNTAMLFPDELDATVIYYGQVTVDEEKLRPINAPILGLFGVEDKGIKVKSVEAFKDSLQTLRKNHEIHVYSGVSHAFANPTGTRYDEAAASDAWQKTLEFLNTHLSTDES